MYDDLVKRLRNLPPEAFTFEIMGAMQEAADAIEELSKPRWIPVTDHTPKYSGYYLVRDTDDDVYTAYFGNTWRNWWTGSTITHWMPRPESPKETIPNEGEHEDGNLY